jgi:hypothetical protein
MLITLLLRASRFALRASRFALRRSNTPMDKQEGETCKITLPVQMTPCYIIILLNEEKFSLNYHLNSTT